MLYQQSEPALPMILAASNMPLLSIPIPNKYFVCLSNKNTIIYQLCKTN